MYTSMNWVIVSSGNGWLSEKHQAITRNQYWLVGIGPLGSNFKDIWIKTQKLTLTNVHLKYHVQNVCHFIQGTMG